jgi:hypothetical protein
MEQVMQRACRFFNRSEEAVCLIPSKGTSMLKKLLLAAFIACQSTHASAQSDVIVRCQFQHLPPVVFRFSDKSNTAQIGKDKPVKALVGSNLTTVEYGAQELTFSLRLPSSVTISAPGQNTRTYFGTCKSTLPH